jgi:DUF1009 family protein
MTVSPVTDDLRVGTQQILGIVAGEGGLPALVAQSAVSRGFSVVALAMSPAASELLRPHCDKVFEIYPGQVSKNIKLAKANGIYDVVMIGKFPKLNILQNITKLDWLAVKELGKLTSFTDDAIQQAVGGLLQREGLNVVPQAQFLRHLFPDVGVLTKRQPTAAEYADIDFGHSVAKEIARLDIGQTVVVRDRIILAVEGAEGTDHAIRRGVELARKPVVVIKVAKLGHDPRFDTPAIGINTLNAMKSTKPGGVLAIGAGETMVVDRDAVIRHADENGMAVVAV